MSTAIKTGTGEFYSSDMGKSALISALFHLVVFVLATVGLPYFVPKTEPIEMAITVDLVDIDDIAQTNLDEPPPPPPKPIYNNTDTAPDLLSPKEPDLVPEIDDIPEPPKDKPEEKPDVTKIEKPPKPKNKPRKPKPPVPEKEAEKAQEEQQQNDFNNLMKSIPTDELEQEIKPAKDNSQSTQVSQVADFSKQLTRTEKDDLNRGVSPCWNVNAGGKNAKDLNVWLRVYINPDMRVREVQVIDKLRKATDTHFRAAAEAASRALLNPRCSTLNLPPEKYEQWKVFKYNFDPSQML